MPHVVPWNSAKAETVREKRWAREKYRNAPLGECQIGNEAVSVDEAAQLNNQLGYGPSADVQRCSHRQIVAHHYYIGKQYIVI